MVLRRRFQRQFAAEYAVIHVRQFQQSQFTTRTHQFDRQAIEAELEGLKEFGAKLKLRGENRQQLALL
jgi:hypothetical protein